MNPMLVESAMSQLSRRVQETAQAHTDLVDATVRVLSLHFDDETIVEMVQTSLAERRNEKTV